MKTLFCLICCLFFLPAQAEILYGSWDKNAAIIVKVYNKDLPQCVQDIDKPIYVESAPRSEIQKALVTIYGPEERQECDGLYIPEPKDATNKAPLNGSFILLQDTLTPLQVEPVLTHEFGHWFYYEYLTTEEKHTWQHIWITEDYLGTHPTQYSCTSDTEGFAETFMLWRLHPNQISPASTAFLTAIDSRLTLFYALGHEKSFYVPTPAKKITP